MGFPRRIFDFYLDSSIHVALAACCLVQVTALTLNIPADKHLAYFVFFSSIPVYNFIKYGVEADRYFFVWHTYHKKIQFFSILSLAFALYHAYFLTHQVHFALVGIAVLVFLYAIPVLPRAANLRNWGVIKIGIVALVWTVTTVFLLPWQAELPFTWDLYVEGLQRFIFVLVWILPFEIRDLKVDNPALQTLPQRLGVRQTKTFGIFLLVLFTALIGFKDTIRVIPEIIKACMALFMLVLLEISKRDQPRYYASFVVEALPVVWFGAIAILEGYSF